MNYLFLLTNSLYVKKLICYAFSYIELQEDLRFFFFCNGLLLSYTYSILFCFPFIVFFVMNTISEGQNSRIAKFQNSCKHTGPKTVDAPESMCRCDVTSTVMRHPSHTLGAHRELHEKEKNWHFVTNKTILF